MTGDDPMPEHVDEDDHVLLDTGFQEGGELRFAPEAWDVALDQIADIGGQSGNPRLQAGRDRGDVIPNSTIDDLHTTRW